MYPISMIVRVSFNDNQETYQFQHQNRAGKDFFPFYREYEKIPWIPAVVVEMTTLYANV